MFFLVKNFLKSSNGELLELVKFLYKNIPACSNGEHFGSDIFEIEARTYFTKAQGILDNVAHLSNTLSNIKKTQTNEYTDMVKLAYELRLLLYRIYNGMFYLSDRF